MAHDHEHEHNHEHIIAVDENGNEQVYAVLYTFDSEDFGKSYVLYYKEGAKEGEEVEIFASAVVPAEDGEGGELVPIETDEEWDMVEEVLNTLDAEFGEE
ncbi:DUF1292 domain-containing protein [Rummeliibacillus sp. SL167]|uniref:DUF1292 domain-containing protein n=1 Tax=Rummeliibacillus sp. SL167 TaxID=2579792 RepID=UPI0011B6F7D7|nr:DUF1292 domain-containing protein [Rummeliibacillus sp. SL167]